MKASCQVMIGALDLNKGGRSRDIQHLVVIHCGGEPSEEYFNVARINFFSFSLHSVLRRRRSTGHDTFRAAGRNREAGTEHDRPVASLQVAVQRQCKDCSHSFVLTYPATRGALSQLYD